MRFLHTSDWHLGRQFNRVNLVEDQAHVLDQLVDLARDARVDAVLIAGDLYDRAVPPTQAVSLCDDVLCRLALGLKLPVIVIAGNHDSPERIGFGGKLMAAGNVHIAGEFTPEVKCITLGDSAGPVQFFAVPYADPPFVRDRLNEPTVSDHDSAMACCMQTLRPRCAGAGAARNILIGHAFVVGGQESESERPLSVGGAGTVSVDRFAGFHYTALGHLHRPQSLNGGSVRYSGSLLKYSFDEAMHTKSVSVVELDAAGKVAVELVCLRPRRDVRCIEGSFKDLLANRDLRTEDYVKIRLTDTDLLYEPLNRLRECFPNVLDLDYAYRDEKASQTAHRVDHTKTGPVDLFKAFYQFVESEPLAEAQTQALTAVVAKLEKELAK